MVSLVMPPRAGEKNQDWNEADPKQNRLNLKSHYYHLHLCPYCILGHCQHSGLNLIQTMRLPSEHHRVGKTITQQ